MTIIAKRPCMPSSPLPALCALAAIFVAPAAAAADDLRGLTECRSEYLTMGVLEKVPGVKVTEDRANSMRYSADPSTLRPFGLPMLTYAIYTRDDDNVTVVVLNGNVDGSFETARDAMLAGWDATSCTQAAPNMGSRRCILDLLEAPSPEFQQNVEVREHQGTVVLECVFKATKPKP